MRRRAPDLSDALKAAKLATSLEREAALRRQIADHKATIADLTDANGELRQLIDALSSLDHVSGKAPAWLTRPPKSKALHHATACLMLSDTHFDEVVEPAAVEGANAYNRAIAVKRLDRTLERLAVLTRDYYTGLRYDGGLLILGGDLLSGDIHEELTETNEDTMLGALDFWSQRVADFVAGMAELFRPLHVVGVVGNHGRTTRKPRHKRKVRSNLDWLLYRTVARAVQQDGVSFTLPESSDVDVRVYQTTYRITHGDQFRGGGGISGMLAPIMRGSHRKALRQMSLRKPYDRLVMGHWHTYFAGLGVVVNGSLKGLDEFAYDHNMSAEPPAQAFWLSTPEHGPSFASPIFPADRKAEGW